MDKIKTNSINLMDDGPPPPTKAGSKSSKKSSTKSRLKTSKNEQQQNNNTAARASASSNSSSSNTNSNITSTTPTTNNRNAGHAQRRTSSAAAAATAVVVQNGNFNDSKKSIGSYNHQSGGQRHNESHSTSSSSSSKGHTKNFVCIEPRSVKISWEQHDRSEVELAPEVCARVAEDASYKLWELMNILKRYIRHSGSVASYNLVNEILRSKDVPPTLGALDNDFDRIDYDGSFYFYLDKIIELRDEFQNNMTITLPHGPDYECHWPIIREGAEALKSYISTLAYVVFHGNPSDVREALNEFAFAPYMGTCYRVLLNKFMEMLAFKQTDAVSVKCWRSLRALSVNPQVVTVTCPEEYHHLSEILICQLLAPCESIKPHCGDINKLEDTQIKLELEMDDYKLHENSFHNHLDIKIEPFSGQINNHHLNNHNHNHHHHQHLHLHHQQQQQQLQIELFHSSSSNNINNHSHNQNQNQNQIININTHYELEEEKIYKIVKDDYDEENYVATAAQKQQEIISPYFACPVQGKYVDDLCETIGHLGAINGHFQNECLFNIIRRFQRFFDGRNVSTEKEYQYISRAVRGLLALGEFSFREFIPFIYEFKANDVPETIWNHFALAGVFLKGADDAFLYEWLECVCGADKLQPFLGYYAHYYEKLESLCFLRRRPPKFKYLPVLGVRRLEWSTLAAAMCHGDDPNNALKPKPTLAEVFPDLKSPNLQRNRPGTIRFKFVGCRPVIVKPKEGPRVNNANSGNINAGSIRQSDILIAPRKLLRPLTDDKRLRHLSSYQSLRI